VQSPQDILIETTTITSQVTSSNGLNIRSQGRVCRSMIVMKDLSNSDPPIWQAPVNVHAVHHKNNITKFLGATRLPPSANQPKSYCYCPKEYCLKSFSAVVPFLVPWPNQNHHVQSWRAQLLRMGRGLVIPGKMA